MQKVKLWTVQKDENGVLIAVDVPSVDNTDTERLFEDLLVQSPHLLSDNLTLIGRQVSTSGGPLDLLGVDEDGRLVIFEIKRELLTRDAVAQILDYGSDLASMDVDRFGKLIEGSSGKKGIAKIDNFQDWYSQSFPNKESILEEPPKMMLVGIGVDDRALRIVNFLAASGINISLLTFNAFKQGASLFLARQVESMAPSAPPAQQAASPTKDDNLRVLKENAVEMKVADYIHEVADFVESKIPAYKWPGKTGYAFSLTEHTEEGKPTLRVYLNVSINWEKAGTLKMYIQERAVQVLGSALDGFKKKYGALCRSNKDNQFEVEMPRDRWPEIIKDLDPILTQMVDGWKKKTAEEDSEKNKSDA
jgi:hypothetical protein